jgi:hypothetical protein
MSEAWGLLVREKWASLLSQGFGVADESEYLVTLESPDLSIIAVHDPRGEVAVSVFRRGIDEHYGWSYSGMVGKASVDRLLEIALAEMRADPEILDGDPEFYATVARDKKAAAHAWTDYYARRGPRPVTRHLP